MKKFIKNYVNKNEERFNYPLINREYDDDLVDYIVDCCKSLEVLEYIKFIGYEYVTNESEINTSEYIDARSRTKPKKNDATKYMYIQDSRYAELRLKFKLECGGESKVITKKLLIPIPDNNLYYTIKGNKYFLLYQVVDAASYTTKSSIVLKSMMPVNLKMKQYTAKSTYGESFTAPIYTIAVFRKDMDVLIFYLAKMGIQQTLEYYSVDKIMRFTESVENPEDFIYFSVSSKLFLEIDKVFFNKYTYVKSVAFMLLTLMTNRMTMENLYNKDFWIEEIGALGTVNKNNQYDKGLNTMIFFDRIIDDTTKRILKLHPIHKKDIYSILRWLIQNFSELRKKDSMDLSNKRLRCNEYIASLLTKTFSEKLNRIIAMGNKATLRNVEEIFKFQGDLILSQLHRSGLLRYDDNVNDLDVFGKLKVTFKGPNSLGNSNDNSISTRFRGLHPSYLGKLDINVCGTSDPGTSAILTPFCKTDGLYFDGINEPEEFKYNFDKDVDNYFTHKFNGLNISPSFDSVKDYYDATLNMMEMNKNLTVEKKKKENKMYNIIINVPEEDLK